MKYIYKIGKLYIVSPKLSENFTPFLQESLRYDGDAEAVIGVNTSDSVRIPNITAASENVLFLEIIDSTFELSNAVKVSTEEPMEVWRLNDSWIYTSKSVEGWLTVSDDYSHAIYYAGKKSDEQVRIIHEYLIQVVIQCKLVRMGYLILHAACVQVNGKAILFSAPSGTGKSTRADRWCEVLGAKYISGDRPIIDPVKGTALGASWDGKEDVHQNVEVPIVAVNRISRSECTRLTRMTEDEKQHFLMTQLYVPMWDAGLVMRVYASVKKMIKRVPIYNLQCDRTVEAARECCDILFPSEPASLVELLEQLRKRDIPQREYKQHIDAYLDFKARRLGVPYQGTFELTPLCNLDCKMCYVHLNRSELAEAAILSVDQWKRWMQEAHDAGMTRAKLTGGECLSYPNFDELYLFLHGLGIEVSVLTNGLLLNADRIEFFKKHPVRLIQVTLYGSDEDAYERVTGVRCFSQVYQNIMRAKDAGLPIMVAITPSVYSYEDMPNLLKLVEKIGVSYNINSSLVDPREETHREIQDLTDAQYLRIYQMRADIRSEMLQPIDSMELPDENDSGGLTTGIRCAAGRSAFCIHWNGVMSPCVNLITLGEVIGKRSFAEVWKSINHTAVSLSVPAECDKCVYKDHCLRCIAQHYNEEYQGKCNRIICERTKMMVESGVW